MGALGVLPPVLPPVGPTMLVPPQLSCGQGGTLGLVRRGCCLDLMRGTQQYLSKRRLIRFKNNIDSYQMKLIRIKKAYSPGPLILWFLVCWCPLVPSLAPWSPRSKVSSTCHAHVRRV